MSSMDNNNNSLDCWLTHALLIMGPFVAWLYGVSVWIMYSLSHECTWGSKLYKLAVRTSFKIGAIAISVGLCRSDQTSFTTVVPLIVVSISGSILLCRWTRIHDVVGVTKAPFYGSRHLHGKTVLITGANSGIGKEATQQLANMGATVYLACRSMSRAQDAVDDILKRQPNIDPSQLKIIPLDLGNLQSIRKAIEGPLKELSTLDILINNAGLMMATRTMTKDGMEMMMQANHLGHYLLTRLLLKKLSNDARIINVTSSTHHLVQDGFDFEDVMCSKTRTYTLFGQYAQTKLANILFSKELAKRYPHWKVYAVHPGLVRTNVTSNMPWILQAGNATFAWYVASLQKTPPQGAYSIVLCATAPTTDLPPSGSYIVNCEAQAPTKAADSITDAERLWTYSEQVVGLTADPKK